MKIKRRKFVKESLISGVAAAMINPTRQSSAQIGLTQSLLPGPEVDEFKKAQQSLLQKYVVATNSNYLKLEKPALAAHVLEGGRGDPVLMLHGGGAIACQFAPLMRSLQSEFHCFAADRPGCGLSDKINYRGIALRQHAVDFVTSVLDQLSLPKAALVGHSMGGLWALVFALAKPERVTKLILLGEPAWSAAEPHAPPPASRTPTIEGVRAGYAARSVADIERVPQEMLEATLAANRLPGAALSWDTLIETFLQEKSGTYHLRPEMKHLRPATLFIWGDKDKFGPPALGQEMAALAPMANCEILPDAGHLIWFDQPDRCAQLTLQFLREGH